MRKKNLMIIILWLCLLPGLGQALPVVEKKTREFSHLKGPYVGQQPPGMKPTVFAPGIVSTSAHEYSFTISKNGTELFFTRQMGELSHIFWCKLQDDKWTVPVIAAFSGKFSDYDQAFSPDGKKLFFVSDRPFTGSNWVGDIWLVRRTGNGWSNPERLPDIINTQLNEACPSVTSDGALYFHGAYSPPGNYDIFRSKFENGQYTKPEALGDGVNTPNKESNAFISPDESFIIFGARRDEGYGRGDLYISFKKKNNKWTKAVNMGPKINTPGSEYCPSVSLDGKYLFFTRIDKSKGTKGDIYWSSAAFIKLLNPDNGPPD